MDRGNSLWTLGEIEERSMEYPTVVDGERKEKLDICFYFFSTMRWQQGYCDDDDDDDDKKSLLKSGASQS